MPPAQRPAPPRAPAQHAEAPGHAAGQTEGQNQTCEGQRQCDQAPHDATDPAVAQQIFAPGQKGCDRQHGGKGEKLQRQIGGSGPAMSEQVGRVRLDGPVERRVARVMGEQGEEQKQAGQDQHQARGFAGPPTGKGLDLGGQTPSAAPPPSNRLCLCHGR
ncbi:MAG: hypothetical protein O7A03_07745 [Alphaproteobacteria bacterium]|nr:hypothetical protein [Alphaproteobacteria bacterium]